MPNGSTTWPTFADGASVVEPQDAETLNGGPITCGQYLRNHAAQINALQSDLGASQNTPTASLRGRISALEQTNRGGAASGVGSLIFTYVATGSISGGRPAVVIVQHSDGTGTVQNTPWTVNVSVTDVANPYGPAANGTLAGVANPNTNLSPTTLKVITAAKQIIFGSDSTGVVTLGLNSTVVGDNLTLLCGSAMGSPALDYSNTFTLTTQA